MANKRVDNFELLSELKKTNQKLDDHIALVQPYVDTLKALAVAGKIGAYVAGFCMGILTVLVAIKKLLYN